MIGPYISEATFSDNSTVEFAQNDIVVFVGPNNAGKSATLAELQRLHGNYSDAGRVVTSAKIKLNGSPQDLLTWLEKTSFVYTHPTRKVFASGGLTLNEDEALHHWKRAELNGIGTHLSRFFGRYLSTTKRLETANPAETISLTSTAPTHPIHYLQYDDQIEKRVSGYFRQAFGVDLIVHRNSCKDVPLYCGEHPALNSGEDRVSARYLRELEKLPKLHEQGDGMRSFTGVLLHAVTGNHTTLWVDEPEAFLHPPQARLLARMLAKETPHDRQLFIATHSGDILKGLLDANKGNVRVIRLTRDGTTNRVRQLSTSDVQNLWSDPLLRHSDVLSGLFHDKVIVCESDADCRFFAAVLDTLFDNGVVARRDSMFVHCGGKARIPTVVNALRAVGVPTCAVTDFDILNDENPLRPICESLGGEWKDISNDWKLVKAAIESKKPELKADEVRAEIQKTLATVGDGIFPKGAMLQIQNILRRSSPWATAKSVGKAFVPSGEVHNACGRLFQAVSDIGLFVVEEGELEGFARSIGGHGPTWVNGVLPKVIANDSELKAAREFVKRLISK